MPWRERGRSTISMFLQSLLCLGPCALEVPVALLPKFFSASLTRLLVFKTLAWALGRGLDPLLGIRVEERADTVTKSFLRKGRTDPALGGRPLLFLFLFPRRTPCPGRLGRFRKVSVITWNEG